MCFIVAVIVLLASDTVRTAFEGLFAHASILFADNFMVIIATTTFLAMALGFFVNSRCHMKPSSYPGDPRTVRLSFSVEKWVLISI